MPHHHHSHRPTSPSVDAHVAFGADPERFDQGLTDAAQERGPDILLQHSVADILQQLIAIDGFDPTAERMARLWDLDPALVKGNLASYLQQQAPGLAVAQPAMSEPKAQAFIEKSQGLEHCSVIGISEVAAAIELPCEIFVKAAEDYGYSIDTNLKCLLTRADFLENVIEYASDYDEAADDPEGFQIILARVKALIPEDAYVDLAH